MFVDFAALKEKVSFGQTVSILKLNLKQSGNQWRGQCPVCGGADRGLVVTDGKGWYCFSAVKGGDQIALVAHVLNCPVKEAAQFLAERAGIRTGTSIPSTSPRQTVPESENGDETQKFAPLSYLQPSHAAVDAIGFSEDICTRVGIGFAPKGILRGLVAVPIRDEHGTLLGYIGISEAKLPASFTTNVIPFNKTA